MPRIKKKSTRQSRLLEAFRAGAKWSEAVHAAGVSERTIRRWCEADPEFADAVDEARDAPMAEVEFAAYQRAIDPDPANNTLRMFFLKCRAPEVWNDKANDPPPAPPAMSAESVAAIFAAIRQVPNATDPGHAGDAPPRPA